MSNLIRTVNPCYPRSGHRFLRVMCQNYLGDRMVFGSVHTDTDAEMAQANYIKDHDFGLLHQTPDIRVRPDTQYLVQYRHPLEAAQSYFEFRVHHGQLSDDQESWQAFLPVALAYWKAFTDKWCLDRAAKIDWPVHRVAYGTLYSDTEATLAGVLTFLTGGDEAINPMCLTRAVERSALKFVRYVDDQGNAEKRLTKARDLRDFRYFDDDLARIEDGLAGDYLTPLGLPKILG